MTVNPDSQAPVPAADPDSSDDSQGSSSNCNAWDMTLYETTVDDYVAHKGKIEEYYWDEIKDTIDRMTEKFGIIDDRGQCHKDYDQVKVDLGLQSLVFYVLDIETSRFSSLPINNVTKWKEWCQPRVDQAVIDAIENLDWKAKIRYNLRKHGSLGLYFRNNHTVMGKDTMILEWLERNMDKNNLPYHHPSHDAIYFQGW